MTKLQQKEPRMFLVMPPPTKAFLAAGHKRSLEDFGESGPQIKGIDTSQIAQAISLDPYYFPEELYSAKDRRRVPAALEDLIQQTEGVYLSVKLRGNFCTITC